MQHLDFPVKYLDLLKDIIREQIPDAEIWAFGSRVNKQNHETSDLDLVIHQKNTASDAFIKFKESILDSNIPILIDVLDWASIPDSFKDEIQKSHVVIYRPDKVMHLREQLKAGVDQLDQGEGVVIKSKGTLDKLFEDIKE